MLLYAHRLSSPGAMDRGAEKACATISGTSNVLSRGVNNAASVSIYQWRVLEVEEESTNGADGQMVIRKPTIAMTKMRYKGRWGAPNGSVLTAESSEDHR